MSWPWSKKWEPEIAGEVGYKELYPIIKALWLRLPSDAMTDKSYRIPADPADLLSHFPDKNLPYIPEKRDCDDFLYMFKGWLAQKGWGDILVMDCKIFVPGKGAHRLAGFLHGGKIVFGDPKSGKISDYPGAIIKRILV